jgi:septal ring factor EnvC (AmiA/AmiB activator)
VLAVRAGARVRAARAGTVSYAGDLSGYGRVVVVKHPHSFASIYARVGTIKVKRGDRVGTGQVISTMSAEGGNLGSELVFQLLYRGKAVVPRHYVKCL